MRVEPAGGAVLAAVNLHLPPGLPTARRRTVVGDASAFLRRAGASVKVVAYDLNTAQGPRGGGWLSKALGPNRTGWVTRQMSSGTCGAPLSASWTGSAWHQRPVRGGEKVLLPGLCTHRMVQCDLGFAEPTFAAADPSCRRFRWSQLRPEQQAPPAAAASLALWWSANARLTVDGAVQADRPRRRGALPEGLVDPPRP